MLDAVRNAPEFAQERKAIAGMALPWERLQKMSDEELIRAFDTLAEHTVVGINYYIAELQRRDAARTNKQLLVLTYIVTGATILALIVAAIALIGSSASWGRRAL